MDLGNITSTFGDMKRMSRCWNTERDEVKCESCESKEQCSHLVERGWIKLDVPPRTRPPQRRYVR
jgi:hypothetical protein